MITPVVQAKILKRKCVNVCKVLRTAADMIQMFATIFPWKTNTKPPNQQQGLKLESTLASSWDVLCPRLGPPTQLQAAARAFCLPGAQSARKHSRLSQAMFLDWYSVLQKTF